MIIESFLEEAQKKELNARCFIVTFVEENDERKRIEKLEMMRRLFWRRVRHMAIYRDQATAQNELPSNPRKHHGKE